MYVDITLPITPKMAQDAAGQDKKALVGHIGTHFDCMNKTFPLHYCRLDGVVFDVAHVGNEREICVQDVDLSAVKAGGFADFYTGWSDERTYGTPEYHTDHPHLSMELVHALLKAGVYIIGVDFVGLRRHEEHVPTDQLCADNGTFVIENLVNLGSLIGQKFTACTYPMNYVGLSGVPCRVVAEVESVTL